MKQTIPIRKWRKKAIGFLSCLFILCTFGTAQAQQATVTGKVMGAKDGAPLPGVTVKVTGTRRGTTTDAGGIFHLSAAKGDVLSFSYLGYLTKKIKVAGTEAPLSIRLSEDVKQLNSVVVVGYGTQKKVNLTGSIATLNMNEKKNEPTTNVSNALHGISGLYVKLGQSMPGADRAQIRIRGIGTLNNSDPLVLVDGIEYPMDELNPNDIASVTVLKDASAAIYGSRAANGVILITTKEGSGKAKVNYSYYYGVQSPTQMPDAIWDPITYMKLMNNAAKNEGKSSPYFTDAQIQEYEQGMKTDPFTYPANNWFDIALEPGKIQKHDLSVSGGTDKARYRLSLGYLNRDGIIMGPVDQEKKYSIGVNTSFQINSKLKVGFTLDGYYRMYSQPTYGNGKFWNYLMRALPVENDTLADGNYGYTWLRVPGRNNWEQPRMLATDGYSRKYIQRFVSSLYADYQLPWNFTYHIKFGVDKYDGFAKVFVPQMYKIQAKTGKRYNWNSPSTAPRSSNEDWNDLNIHFYNTLSWQKTFNKAHHLAAMAGASYDNYNSRGFSAEMTGYLDGTLDALSAGTVRQATSGNETRDVLESYFGRVNYDYKGKYLLEGIFRYDGSARFSPIGHRRWGFFPGVSAGWRIDKENFFSSNFIDLLKLRASYGQLGNQSVDLYSYENSITLGHDYSFGGPNGVLASGAA
ncbi:MAG TPA: SusC/RagA family TonB-linked outer membrane protein, partial [Chitinophagaceae bacterium]|nr:SusC/RagA family TonB-linked outer membrane protein [Chitinophagaceae bacterium]